MGVCGQMWAHFLPRAALVPGNNSYLSTRGKLTPAALHQLFLSLQLLLKIWGFLPAVLSMAKGRDQEQKAVSLTSCGGSLAPSTPVVSGRQSSRCECSGEPIAVVREC